MKACPYCGKEIGNRVCDNDFEWYEDDYYVDKDGKTMYFFDYVVSCPNCKGSFHWVENFQKVTTIITKSEFVSCEVYRKESE